MNARLFGIQIQRQFLFLCLMLFGLGVNSFAAPGDLDLSFGNGGRVVTRFENRPSRGTAITIQKDGKIITVGYTAGAGVNKVIVNRYNLDGTLDTGFNGNGIATFSDSNIIAPTSVALQSDGKIVVAGFGFKLKGGYWDFFVVRFNSDGSLDSSFNSNGFVRTHITLYDNFAQSVIIQPDGKIVVSGFGDAPGDYRNKIVVVRYNSDGSLDTSFNGNGKFISQFQNGNYKSYDAVLQSDGKIILASSFDTYNVSSFAVLRLNANGTLDSSFNGNGITLTSFDGNSAAYAVTIQSDGKIVAVGSAGNFAIARYNPNGTLDLTFDGDGKVKTIISPYGSGASDVVVQENGKIVVGGNATDLINSGSNSIGKFAFARYNSDSSPDNTFSNDGQTTIAVRDNDALSEIAIQQDGKIVAVGSTKKPYNGDEDVAIIRLQNGEFAANKPMFDFDGDGKSDISVFRDGIWHLQRSQAGFGAVYWGLASDKIAPADFDGDGKTDPTVYRPSNGEWSILRSSDNTATVLRFGAPEDLPRPADFDGDGKADITVFRPSNGTWFRINSSNNQFYAVQFGAAGDAPVVADFDGDGKADIAVYRPSNGTWYWLRSSDGHFAAVQFGISEDKPVPADYDGDGKTDIAVWRPSNGVWYRLNSSNNQFFAVQFGTNGDVPTAGDYDGDGKADIAVFRNGIWYLQQSTAGFTRIQFGAATGKPVQSAFVP